MQVAWLRHLCRHSLAKRNRPGVRRARRRFASLFAEVLEDRTTPAGNLFITNAFLVDSNDHVLNTVNPGEAVYVQANYTTQNLPANASYHLSFDVNGFTLNTSTTTAGAGSSGTGTWFFYWGYFLPTLGTNQVTATVDPDHTVAETSFADNSFNFSFTAVAPNAGVLTYSVSQIRAAYGIDTIPNFGSAAADGTGQTIAIIDMFNDPSILTDLDLFDQSMNISSNSSPTLYQQYGAASSILSVFNQNGVNITSSIANSGVGNVPPVDPTGGWEGEETMDVEWAHAIAPGAHIDLIETSGSGSFGGLYTGAATAAHLPGVSVMSMSWIWFEGDFTSSQERAFDTSTFETPSGHVGVTFLASSGDGGTPGGSPAMSPNVIAVSGTELTVNNGGYGSETAWSFPTPRTLNEGSSSYSQTGPWTGQSGGFSGAYATAAAGANSTATWRTSISSADQGWVGGTEVSATWVASPTNATNATYMIYDGTSSSGTLLGTVSVDQTKAPVGIVDGNTKFQELGDYFPSSGSLTVILKANNANGTVVADAIGIAQAWATGGGLSQFEPEPTYQLSVQNSGQRSSPDVSFDGSINSGVTCIQNGGLGYDYAGTSLSSPCFAGLMAIVNQGLTASGNGTLNSPNNPQQVLQGLYSLPAADFHDITTGYNGLLPAVGYDMQTGLGTPIANKLVPDLISYASANVTQSTVQVAQSSIQAGGTTTVTLIAKDAGGQIEGKGGLTVTFGLGSGTSAGMFSAVVDHGDGTYTATFTGTTAGTAVQITATIQGNAVASALPTVQVTHAAASKVIFSQQPSNVVAGVAMNPAVVVYVEDAFGNLVTDNGTIVTLTLSSATFEGGTNTTAVTASNGIATFANLKIRTPPAVIPLLPRMEWIDGFRS